MDESVQQPELRVPGVDEIRPDARLNFEPPSRLDPGLSNPAFADGTLTGWQATRGMLTTNIGLSTPRSFPIPGLPAPSVPVRGAFDNQPTFGDNVRMSRVRSPGPLGGDYWDGPFPLGRDGRFWIGTYEDRHTPADPWGGVQGDGFAGTLTSGVFHVQTRYLSFLIGGGGDVEHERVELQIHRDDAAAVAEAYAQGQLIAQRSPEHVEAGPNPIQASRVDGDFVVVREETGQNNEQLRLIVWDLLWFQQTNARARLRIVDQSTGGWGHINVADFAFSDDEPEPPPPVIWGVADLHAHPMGHLAFGGHYIPNSPTDAMDAIVKCDGRGHGGGPLAPLVLHFAENAPNAGSGVPTGTVVAGVAGGLLGGPFGAATLGLVEFGVEKVAPEFRHPSEGWPTFRTTAHQQMHIDWIRRAYDGGLRVMIADAVHNELIAALMGSDPTRIQRRKDDLVVAREQLEAIKGLVEQNSGWMEVAYSAADARRIATADKLAVILGIELDQPNGWNVTTPVTTEQITALVSTLAEWGVRVVTPIHLADNVFGGTAIAEERFIVNNLYLNGQGWNVQDGHSEVSGDNVELRLSDLGIPHELLSALHDAGITTAEVPLYNAETTGVPDGHGMINQRGLTTEGTTYVQQLMTHGMLIQVSHMGDATMDGTLSLAEQHGYPVIASHTGFREMAPSGHANERGLSATQVRRIAALGGVVGVGTGWEEVRSDNPPGTSLDQISNDCPGSTKSWARNYLYARAKMGGRGVAIGTDCNGLNGALGPRFGTEAGHDPAGHSLNPNAPQDHQVAYSATAATPANQPLAQVGSWDFNTQALAHYGMLPDFFQDTRNIGLTQEDLTPLFRSADDLIVAWETCERIGEQLRH